MGQGPQRPAGHRGVRLRPEPCGIGGAGGQSPRPHSVPHTAFPLSQDHGAEQRLLRQHPAPHGHAPAGGPGHGGGCGAGQHRHQIRPSALAGGPGGAGGRPARGQPRPTAAGGRIKLLPSGVRGGAGRGSGTGGPELSTHHEWGSRAPSWAGWVSCGIKGGAPHRTETAPWGRGGHQPLAVPVTCSHPGRTGSRHACPGERVPRWAPPAAAKAERGRGLGASQPSPGPNPLLWGTPGIPEWIRNP